MPESKKIIICYTDAGGGHRATARALKAVLGSQTIHQVSLLNPYKELIADVDLFPRFCGHSDEEVYNRLVLGKDWPRLLCFLYYGLTILNVRLGTRVSARRFRRHWQKERPDLVISLMPLANQGLRQSVETYFAKRPLPFLVLCTDLAEEMPRIWFPKQRDYYIACGSPRCHRQALAKPHPPALTFRTSGLPVHPAFYAPRPADREDERRKLGLSPRLATGCMMYGSAGSPRMVELALALARSGKSLQMIFLCGHNQALAEQLSGLDLPYPHLVRAYTTRVPYYFSLADFLVCKPGPGTISEALVSGLDLLLDRRNVLPQESYNLGWVRQLRRGLSFSRPGEFLAALDSIAPRDRLRPAREENRAIWELPAIIESILRASTRG